jgi:hypothetical protein
VRIDEILDFDEDRSAESIHEGSPDCHKVAGGLRGIMPVCGLTSRVEMLSTR